MRSERTTEEVLAWGADAEIAEMDHATVSGDPIHSNLCAITCFRPRAPHNEVCQVSILHPCQCLVLESHLL